jgi:hypothetical protein
LIGVTPLSIDTQLHHGVFGPTVDRRTLPSDDLRRLMSDRSAEDHLNHAGLHPPHQGSPTSGPAAHGQLPSSSSSVFANVSLLIGFSAGQGPSSLFVPPLLDAAVGSGTGYQLGRTVGVVVNSLFARNRQTIVDVLLHQVCELRAIRSVTLLTTKIKAIHTN